MYDLQGCLLDPSKNNNSDLSFQGGFWISNLKELTDVSLLISVHVQPSYVQYEHLLLLMSVYKFFCLSRLIWFCLLT